MTLVDLGRILLGLFRRSLFRCKDNRTYRISFLKEQNSWRDNNWGDETEEISVHNFPAERKETISGYSVYSEKPAITSIPFNVQIETIAIQ